MEIFILRMRVVFTRLPYDGIIRLTWFDTVGDLPQINKNMLGRQVGGSILERGPERYSRIVGTGPSVTLDLLARGRAPLGL